MGVLTHGNEKVDFTGAQENTTRLIGERNYLIDNLYITCLVPIGVLTNGNKTVVLAGGLSASEKSCQVF
jgi:hypothetical protein